MQLGSSYSLVRECCVARLRGNTPMVIADGEDIMVSVGSMVSVDSPRNFHDKYIIGEKLAQGSFAHVYSANRTGKRHLQERAVKVFDLRAAGPALRRMIKNEIHILTQLGRHRHCVQIYDALFGAGGDLCYIVLEKCSSTLMQYLEQLPEVNERSLGYAFYQMLLGIEHLHANRVVHRDIKPDTFFVGSLDGFADSTIKLGEVGSAAVMPDENWLRGEFGTTAFMCPEMLSGLGYDEKADIWSFAVLVYLLLFGKFPYTPNEKNSEDMKQSISAGRKISFKSTISHSCSVFSFVMTLLCRDAVKRPRATDALSMSYMTSSHADCHQLGVELPSLRLLLYMAKKAHAYGDPDFSRETATDELLNTLQMARHGIPLPPPPLPKRSRIPVGVSLACFDSDNQSVGSTSCDSACSV